MKKISIFLLLLNFYLPTYFGSRSSHSADLHSTVWIYLVIQPKQYYANHIYTVIIVIFIVLFWKNFWSHFPNYERNPCTIHENSRRSFIPFVTVTWSSRKLDRVPWFVAKLLYGELKSTYVAVSFPSVKKWLDT